MTNSREPVFTHNPATLRGDDPLHWIYVVPLRTSTEIILAQAQYLGDRPGQVLAIFDTTCAEGYCLQGA